MKGLNAPRGFLAKLFGVMTPRTADGHDILLDELLTPTELRSGETVLAKGVVVHLPEGRASQAQVNWGLVEV